MYAHSSHILQPPHSAGLKFQGWSYHFSRHFSLICQLFLSGLRNNIDQSQIPSPVDAIEADREQWEGQTFMTLPGNHAPLSTTDFVAIDQSEDGWVFVSVQLLTSYIVDR